MNVLMRVCSVVLALGMAGMAVAQSTSPPAQDYQKQVTGALNTAKKSADALNEQHKALLAALKNAADGQQAQKVLDDLIKSTTTALASFREDSEVMKLVTSILSYIEEKRTIAEKQVAEKRWRDSVDHWRSEGDSIRKLRQTILVEVDRGNANIEKLKKDRAFIEDIIAREGVAAARVEMEKALLGLKALGDSIEQAINVTETRHRKVPGG